MIPWRGIAITLASWALAFLVTWALVVVLGEGVGR